MKHLRQNNASIFLLVIDCIVLAALFFGFLFIRFNYIYFEVNLSTLGKMFSDQYKAFILIMVSWYFISQYTQLYRGFRFSKYINYIKGSLFQIVLFSFVLFTVSGIKFEYLYSNEQAFAFISILSVYLIFSRSAIYYVTKRIRKQGFNLRNVAIIGFNENAKGLMELLSERKDLGLHLSKIYVTKNPQEGQELLDLDSFKKSLIEEEIEFLYICLGNGLDEDVMNQVTDMAESQYVHVGFVPNSSFHTRQSLDISYLDTFPILTYKHYPLDHSFNQIIKRLFDLFFTLMVFVFILSWLYPILALLVLIYQGRPIHFSQKRNGLNGKEFSCLKFRTMRDDKNNNRKPTERDDPRVTKLGRILRKTSLDELPQFINVLKGEMSIVGPRPHMVSENESYSDIIKRYSLRHYVKPGITGLAQTRGYRGVVESDKDMEMRIRTDIYYVRNWSFLLDLVIIFRTIKLMISGDENAI